MVLLAGCATDRQRTQAEGAGAGALIGAGLGAALGALLGGEKGAAIGTAGGAVLGAGAGYAYGTHVASQKANFATQEEDLDTVLASAQRINEQSQ